MTDDWKSANVKLQINRKRIKEMIHHLVFDALVKRIEDITAKLEHLVIPSCEAADAHANIRRLPNNGEKGLFYCIIDKELLLHLIIQLKIPQNNQAMDDVLGYISATLDGIERVCFLEEINQQMIGHLKFTNTKLQINRERIKEVIHHPVFDAFLN